MSGYRNERIFALGSLRFFGFVCAAWAGLATPALAQEFTANRGAGSDSDPDVQVAVSSYMTVDLHVQNTDLAKVLQMLSIQSQRNIIVSRNVSGTVSADLYDVTLYEALDAILNVNGFGYIEEGNFIKVYTLEEIRALEEAQRQKIHRTFRLSYLNAADASAFVTPLLSDRGAIALSGDVSPGIKPAESDAGDESWAFAATLVVHDFPENVEQIARLLAELDMRPKQVLLEAAVLQTSLNEDNAWGIDWSIVFNTSDFTDFINPLSSVDNLLSGGGDGGFQPEDNRAGAIRSNVGRTTGPGGLKLGVVSNDISVFMRILDQVTDTTVISRPRVLALNRNRGEILVGTQVGYLSTTSTETSTTQSVQFLDTGTQLIFRPFIAEDGFIRMELKPSVSEAFIREVGGADGSIFTIPDKVTQEITTNVVVRDGHTIVLGGLFREQTTLQRRQIPVLGDIPIIGAAFKGREDATSRSEITFLITPTVMKDEDLLAHGQHAAEMVEYTRFGARSGVLWWSNDRLTSQHNLKAEELIAEGDFDLALWHIDKSLSLRRNQPLVLQMRERITGDRREWFHGSIMQSMSREFLDQAIAERAMSRAKQADFSPADPVHKKWDSDPLAAPTKQADFSSPDAKPQADAKPQMGMKPGAKPQADAMAQAAAQPYEESNLFRTDPFVYDLIFDDSMPTPLVSVRECEIVDPMVQMQSEFGWMLGYFSSLSAGSRVDLSWMREWYQNLVEARQEQEAGLAGVQTD